MDANTNLVKHSSSSPFDFSSLYLVELGFLCQFRSSSFRFFADAVFNS